MHTCLQASLDGGSAGLIWRPKACLHRLWMLSIARLCLGSLPHVCNTTRISFGRNQQQTVTWFILDVQNLSS